MSEVIERDISKFYYPNQPRIWLFNSQDKDYFQSESIFIMRRRDEHREFMKSQLSPEYYAIWLEEWINEE